MTRRATPDCLIRVQNQTFRALVDGALYWPERRAVIVADLHLEKGSSFARSGQLLPPYDSLATLGRLSATCAGLRPETIILLGDSLHDPAASGRLPDAAWRMLTDLRKDADLIWISGNHDPVHDPRLPGRSVDQLSLDGIAFRHIPDPGTQTPEIAGHFHPVARVATSMGRARRKAFVGDGQRLILPAYGAYTGGLNILSPVLLGLFDAQKLIACLCGDAGVFPVSADRLVPDRRLVQPVRA